MQTPVKGGLDPALQKGRAGDDSGSGGGAGKDVVEPQEGAAGEKPKKESPETKRQKSSGSDSEEEGEGEEASLGGEEEEKEEKEEYQSSGKPRQKWRCFLGFSFSLVPVFCAFHSLPCPHTRSVTRGAWMLQSMKVTPPASV